MAVYSENNTKPVNKLNGQNVELLNVKAGGKYNCRSALKIKDLWIYFFFI
jgi:hypothetical protein